MKQFFAVWLLAVGLVVVGGSVPACVHQPPVGTYTPGGTRAYNADQVLKDLTALSQTAVNLNGVQGKLHLSDRDTRLVRDFVLATTASIEQYAAGTGASVQVRAGLDQLLPQLSAEAKSNGTLTKVLAVVVATIESLPR